MNKNNNSMSNIEFFGENCSISFEEPDIEIIDLEDLNALRAVAGSCGCHCDCRSR